LKGCEKQRKSHNVIAANSIGTQPNTAAGTEIAPSVDKITPLHNMDASLKRSLSASTVEETTWPAMNVVNGTKTIFAGQWEQPRA